MHRYKDLPSLTQPILDKGEKEIQIPDVGARYILNENKKKCFINQIKIFLNVSIKSNQKLPVASSARTANSPDFSISLDKE